VVKLSGDPADSGGILRLAKEDRQLHEMNKLTQRRMRWRS
jgi:hypothetical protein